MTQIVKTHLDQVMETFPELDRGTVRAAIVAVSRRYSVARNRGETTDFGTLICDELLDVGTFDLFTSRTLKEALGKYFGLQRNQKQFPTRVIGTVLEADAFGVLIIASEAVNLRFKPSKRTGKLIYQDVVVRERFVVYGTDDSVSNKEFQSAKVKALKILNERRGFR